MIMKKRWMTAAAAALLAAGMICGCSNPQKAGVKALEEGNYEEAQVQFEKLTEEDGRDAAEGWRGLGMARYETEDYQGALDAFGQAVENGISPTAQMYNLMAVCAMQTEQYGPALEYIRSGLALADSASGDEQPSDGLIQEMRFNEIICCERQADWTGAKQKVTEYLEAYPDDEAAQKEAEFLATR